MALTVISTFSGGGGSSEGYRMAGYQVLAAVEQVQTARDTYAANHPDTHLLAADVRDLSAADLLDATGLERGELDLFDGSPPCQAFSTAGPGSKGWNTGKALHDDGSVRSGSQEMFLEFARLLDGLRPRAFVAENVPALAEGRAAGLYNAFMAALAAPGYRVRAYILDASRLGVPQRRRRLFITGVREDLGLSPPIPAPLPGPRPSMCAALDLDPQDLLLMHRVAPGGKLSAWPVTRPSPTITADGVANVSRGQHGLRTSRPRPASDPETGNSLLGPGVKAPNSGQLTLAEVRILCGFPPGYVLAGSHAERWRRLGNAVPPPMTAAVARAMADEVLSPGTVLA